MGVGGGGVVQVNLGGTKPCGMSVVNMGAQDPQIRHGDILFFLNISFYQN